MKALIVGLGSMGKRRIRLLKNNFNDIELCGVDSREDRRSEVTNIFSISTYDNLDVAINNFKPDCVIVSTSPLSHADIIEKCLYSNCHVFTELNLVPDKYESNLKIAKDNNKVLFLSSTCIYKQEVEFMYEKIVNCNCKLNYTYHIGQYLPDWHPWETLDDFFVSDKRTNGCKELFAIELPWIVKTFGKVKSFNVIKNKISTLNLKFNDNYLLIVEHESGHKGVIALDVVSRKAVRNFEVYGENLYISWDGTPKGLFEYDYKNKSNNNIKLYTEVDKQDGYADFIIENAYLKELETFFDSIQGKSVPKYSFEEDLYILELISNIEK